MPIKPEDIPQYPDTLTFIPMEEASRSVFAFVAIFPNGRRVGIRATYPPGVVDVAHTKDFAEKLVEKLLMERDEAAVRNTNWASAMAAIQRLLIDFNTKRQPLGAANDGTMH